MKKYSKILIVALSTSLLLSACDGKSIASDKALVNGNEAVEVAEGYIAGDISGDDAYESLDKIYAALSYAADYTYEEKTEDQQKYADNAIYLDIFILKSEISTDSGIFGDAETFEKVEKYLQNLQDTIKKYD